MENKLKHLALFFIKKASQDGLRINHKKLQKLCYYSQAWTVTLIGKTLFKESIEAWVNGPVIPSLWHAYKIYGYNDIKATEKFEKDVFSNDEQEVLDSVYKIYGKSDSDYLVWLTHQEKPWLEARGELLESDPSNNKISIESMKAYYSSLLKKK